MLFVVNLLYQRFGAIFMSIHQFVKLFCLNYQAYSPTLLVGKLSNSNYGFTDIMSMSAYAYATLYQEIEEKFSNPNPEEVKSFGWNRIKTKEEDAKIFQVGEPECFLVPSCWAPNSMITEVLLFRTSPYVSLHLAIDMDPLISFVINQ